MRWTLGQPNICQKDFPGGIIGRKRCGIHMYNTTNRLSQTFVGMNRYGLNTDPILHIVSATNAGKLNPTEKMSWACIILLSDQIIRAISWACIILLSDAILRAT